MSKRKGAEERDKRPQIEGDAWKLAGIGDTAGLRALSDKGVLDVGALDAYGCTPVVWAARNGYLETVKYLAELGADLEARGFGGLTPLHHACNQLRDDVLAHLLKSGANVNAVDENGNTPLHFAAERGVLEPLEALIAAGAPVGAANAAGATALHKAANDGHISIVQRLVRNGADINAQDSKGNVAPPSGLGCESAEIRAERRVSSRYAGTGLGMACCTPREYRCTIGSRNGRQCERRNGHHRHKAEQELHFGASSATPTITAVEQL